MYKNELIDAIAEKTGCAKTQAKSVLDAIIEISTETLAKGESITLVGFGSLSIVKRPARKGRNPQTKKEMMIPAKNVVKFKVGADLKSQV